MRKSIKLSGLCLAAAMVVISTNASAATLLFTELSGVTGAPGGAGTGVYRANLGALGGTFGAISITDASGGFGGAAGRFSGFDLDAIILSTTFCTTAACVASATPLGLFNFSTGIVFTPGTQRAPTDPKLFGTGPSGVTVDNSVATLGSFDAFSSTVTPAGFLSLGDRGSIVFNLTSITSTDGLYLYIGEVGNNGEVACSNVNLLPNQLAAFQSPQLGPCCCSVLVSWAAPCGLLNAGRGWPSPTLDCLDVGLRSVGPEKVHADPLRRKSVAVEALAANSNSLAVSIPPP